MLSRGPFGEAFPFALPLLQHPQQQPLKPLLKLLPQVSLNLRLKPVAQPLVLPADMALVSMLLSLRLEHPALHLHKRLRLSLLKPSALYSDQPRIQPLLQPQVRPVLHTDVSDSDAGLVVLPVRKNAGPLDHLTA